MKDFKMSDFFEEISGEELEKRQKQKRIKNIIIIIVTSFVVGILIFFIINSLINNKEEQVVANQIMNVSDENVRIMYNLVTYSDNGKRNDIFVKNKNVDIDTFTDEDKFYYAFQFLNSRDFEFTGEMDQNNNKIYTIPDNIIKKYMIQFFGPNVKYSNNLELTHQFSFAMDKNNVADIKYNENKNSLDVVFTKYNDTVKEKDDFCTELISAEKTSDGKIVLKERVIYTDVEDNGNDTYNLKLYKDYNKEILLESKNNLTKENLDIINIDVTRYNNSSIVEYTFMPYNNTFYFLNSKIIM